MVHAYPHLPSKLETQTVGLFDDHRLIPRLQDIVPIAIYLAYIYGWLAGTGHWDFDTVKQILRAESQKELYLFSVLHEEDFILSNNTSYICCLDC